MNLQYFSDQDFYFSIKKLLKILQNLAIPTSGKKAVTTFNGLYDFWQEVFSVSLLSKQFYHELSNWYFWALKHVEFPDDTEKDRGVRNATSASPYSLSRA